MHGKKICLTNKKLWAWDRGSTNNNKKKIAHIKSETRFGAQIHLVE